MKKLLLAVSVLGLMSTTVSAESLVLQAGYASNESGDLSSNSVVVDGSLLLESGVLVGVYLNTDPTDHETKTLNNVKTDLVNLGIYTGYQFDNGIRLTAGFDSVSYSESYRVNNKDFIVNHKVDSNTSVGFNAGVGYMFDNGVTVNYRYTQNEVDSVAGAFDVVSHTVLVGYKF